MYLSFISNIARESPRSLRHVDLSHSGKTGAGSVTSAYSKICGYDCPHISEFAAYSKMSTLETVFENFRIRLPNLPDTYERKPYSEKNCGYQTFRIRVDARKNDDDGLFPVVVLILPFLQVARHGKFVSTFRE